MAVVEEPKDSVDEFLAQNDARPECQIKLCDGREYAKLGGISLCHKHFTVLEDAFKSLAKETLERIEQILRSAGFQP